MPQAYYRDQTTTIYDFPNEILESIFVLASSAYVPIPPTSTSPPWNISLVSKHWRALALEVPFLWDHILFRSQPGRPPIQLTRLVHEAAFRHRLLETIGPNRLLYLSNDESSTDELDASAILGFLEFLTPISGRLRRLTFRCKREGFLSLLCLPSGSFPMLEEIAIILGDRGLVHVPDTLVALQNAPQLVKVSFRCPPRYTILVDVTMLKFPWGQLTSLQFTNVHVPPTCLPALLQRCENITNLRLELALYPFPSFCGPQSIAWLASVAKSVHPSITTFEARVYPESGHLLSALNFPNLEYLTLHLIPKVCACSAVGFIARSCRQNLKGLNLICDLGPEPDLEDNIRYMEDILLKILVALLAFESPVEDLRLLCSFIPKVVYNAINLKGRRLLNLRRFTANMTDQMSVTDFLDVVHALKEDKEDDGGRRFEGATVIVREELNEENTRRIGDLRKQGVDLKVVQYQGSWDGYLW